MQKKNIFVIFGPSGAGKSSLSEVLRKRKDMAEIVSHTTRKIRPGEVDGQDYHFTDPDTFKQMIKNNDLIEWVEYNNHFYGISKIEINNKLKVVDSLFVTTEQVGVEHLRNEYDREMITAIYVYSDPFTVLQRLVKRDGFKKAMKRYQEVINKNEFTLLHLADFVIINKDLQESKDHLGYIIENKQTHKSQ